MKQPSQNALTRVNTKIQIRPPIEKAPVDRDIVKVTNPARRILTNSTSYPVVEALKNQKEALTRMALELGKASKGFHPGHIQIRALQKGAFLDASAPMRMSFGGVGM